MTLPPSLTLDTNCLIYRLDDPDGDRGRWLDQHVFRPAVDGRMRLAVPTLSLAEVLVRPYADGYHDRARALRRALETLPGLALVPLTADIADAGARLRASAGLSLPDALVLATASAENASLLTNDRGLVQPAGSVSVLVLDDEMARTP